MMNAAKYAQIKEALKTQRAKVLLGLGIFFVFSVYWILTLAFDSILSNQFEEYFWILALSEIAIAAIAIAVCYRFGNLGVLKLGNSIQSVIHKLFRH
jgi:hypothetical protein